jgi:electron transfer flavoprotein alpha/beta subunit
MTLRVFVQVWCEIDPTLNVRIDRQSGRPAADPGDRLWRVSPLGKVAVATASGLGGSVTAFALGDGHADALRSALAAGAGRAVELLAPGEDAEAVAVAGLAEWLRDQRPDLVIADRLSGPLAARLGWAHLAGLDELRVEDGRLRAVRFLGRGDREVVTARLPAAVRLQAEAVRVPYVARARIHAAAGRPIERETLSGPAPTAAAAGPLQVARARTRLGKQPAPAASSAGARLQALMGAGTSRPAAPRRAGPATPTPEELAEEFVRYLLHHGLLPER